MSLALVLSGGGSKGDFELGAIQYLYRIHGIQPTLIVGTSVGAINGAKLAEGEGSVDSGLRGLERTWYTLDRNEDMWLYEPWLRNASPEVAATVSAAADTHLFSLESPTAPSLLPADAVDMGGLRDLVNSVTQFSFLISAALQYGSLVAKAIQAASIANLNPIRIRSSVETALQRSSIRIS